MLNIKCILHPTDFSEHSENAFRLACALARDYGARLVVLHVISPQPFIPPEGVVAAPLPREDPRQVQEQLRQFCAPDAKIPCEHRLSEGSAASEILRAAEDSNCDLIVMGTHGRTGLGRLLMGSVAEKVVRTAACPVLTVKTPLPEASS